MTPRLRSRLLLLATVLVVLVPVASSSGEAVPVIDGQPALASEAASTVAIDTPKLDEHGVNIHVMPVPAGCLLERLGGAQMPEPDPAVGCRTH